MACVMSLYDYQRGIDIYKEDEPFYALIMAAMLKADSDNAFKLRQVFPETWSELSNRYQRPGGRLEGEE
jgi:hypothetical protein